METSRILARIIGPLLIVPAVGVFSNMATYRPMVEEFSKSPSLCYLGGFMALLFGLVVLQFHDRWEAGWPVIITILGWITVVKGAVLILFPGVLFGLWTPSTGTVPMAVSLGISLVIGVFLTVKGYSRRSDDVPDHV